MRSSTFDSDHEVLRRIVPTQPWARVFLLVLLTEIICVASWESFWRAHYFVPDDYEDTPAMWQMQRERVTGGATVLIGSSRMWQDVDLTAWERVTGTRPIQLAIAGRNPRPVLRELAADPLFHGLVVCEVTPYLFFAAPETETADFMRRGRTQTLSQRASNRLDVMFERWLAFIDNETRISTLWKRAAFPPRAGTFPVRAVPKGHVMRADRDTRMWARIEADADYRALFQRLWLFYAGGPQPSLEEKPPGPSTAYPGIVAIIDKVSAQAAADIERIRARGGDVAFIRFPSSGPVYLSEARSFPRSLSWEPFLTKTRSAGVHFEDYTQLQGYRLPEWSHMAAGDSGRFTCALAPLVLQAVAANAAHLSHRELTINSVTPCLGTVSLKLLERRPRSFFLQTSRRPAPPGNPTLANSIETSRGLSPRLNTPTATRPPLRGRVHTSSSPSWYRRSPWFPSES
jgi:hypothetical protein